jgi:hypothetical protein
MVQKRQWRVRNIIIMVCIAIVSLVFLLSENPWAVLLSIFLYFLVFAFAGAFVWSLSKTKLGNGYRGMFKD